MKTERNIDLVLSFHPSNLGRLARLALFSMGFFVDLKVTTDFRRVYSTVLEQVLGADPAGVLGRRFDPLGFL